MTAFLTKNQRLNLLIFNSLNLTILGQIAILNSIPSSCRVYVFFLRLSWYRHVRDHLLKPTPKEKTLRLCQAQMVVMWYYVDHTLCFSWQPWVVVLLTGENTRLLSLHSLEMLLLAKPMWSGCTLMLFRVWGEINNQKWEVPSDIIWCYHPNMGDHNYLCFRFYHKRSWENQTHKSACSLERTKLVSTDCN